jgi:hypothetical protein
LALTLASALWSPTSFAAGVPVDQANKDQWRAAQKTFRVADDLFDAKRFSEAITAYRASYDIVASPNSRLQIARSLRALGRLREAYAELQGTIADAEQAAEKDDKYARTADAAKKELAELRAQVGLLTIRIADMPDGTSVQVGGRTVRVEELSQPLVVKPGVVVVEASAAGRPGAKKEVQIEGGGEATVQLDLGVAAPDQQKPSPSSTPSTQPIAPVADHPHKSSLKPYAYIAGGVGVVGLATFSIFGLMANSKYDDLDGSCPAGHCTPDQQSDIDAGRRNQTIANIGLAVGAVGLGAGVALFFLDSGAEKPAGQSATLGVGPGSVQLSGSF